MLLQRASSSYLDSDDRVPVSTDPRGVRYTCSVCHSPLHRDARACMVCGARTAGVQCSHCRFVGPPERFANHVCPSCGIEPAPVPQDELLLQETDPVDGRPVEPWHFASRYSSWLDLRGLIVLFALAAVLLVVTPAFAAALRWGFVSAGLKWVSLLSGAALAWYGVREIAWARSWPSRVLFYAAVALGILAIVLGASYPVR